MLARPADPPDAREQVEADGSFDHCSEAWFLKLDSTIEEVEYLTERGEKPKWPLKLLDRVNSPEKLRGYLDSLLVSDVRRTGIDNRFELNIAVTAIERFVVGHVEHDYPFHPDLKRRCSITRTTTGRTRRPGISAGGTACRTARSAETADLSVTFHIASYRRDTLRHVPEMADDAGAKDQEYPFGWRRRASRPTTTTTTSSASSGSPGRR